MAHDTHAHGAANDHHIKTYLRVFVALAVFTAIEYFFARIFKDAFVVLVLGLLAIAGIKAAMVGAYFMHLKYEGRWVFFMLVPASILAVIMILALCPDIAMNVSSTEDDDEIAIIAPLEPVAGPRIAAR